VSRAGDRFGTRRFQRPEDDPPGTSRLFVAVPLADDVRRAVGRLMEDVAGAPVDERTYGQPRWVRVDGLHLTLRFLGATPDARQPELAEALRSAADGAVAFDVALAGGGAFPDAARPRVLWLGIDEGAGSLGSLAARLATELSRLGWPPEDRPFKPHLTLARTDGVPGAADRAGRLVELGASFRAGWQADRLVLYRSLLGRGPARYEAVAEAPLRAP
jgi:2'-5' RNA ligase